MNCCKPGTCVRVLIKKQTMNFRLINKSKMKNFNFYKQALLIMLSLFVFTSCHSQAQQERQENTSSTNVYTISNKKSGLLLHPYDANRKDGIKVVLYPERNWECLKWDVDSVGDNSFYLQNLFTHKTFQPQDENSILSGIIQQPLDKKDNVQQWSFIKLDNGYYSISHTQSGLYLTAKSEDAYNQQVFLSEWENREEQEWKIKKVSAESDM